MPCQPQSGGRDVDAGVLDCKLGAVNSAFRRDNAVDIRQVRAKNQPKMAARPVTDTAAPVTTLYSMVGACILATKSVRATLPSLIPLIAQSQGLASAEAALLMSAFYPGYILTQIPAGALAQKHGAKGLLLLCLLGTAACFGGLPFAFQGRWGMLLPAALLTTMGLCQGSLIPGVAAIHSDWLPDSPSRPLILQAIFLCHSATSFVRTPHPCTPPHLHHNLISRDVVETLLMITPMYTHRSPQSPRLGLRDAGGGGLCVSHMAWPLLRWPCCGRCWSRTNGRSSWAPPMLGAAAGRQRIKIRWRKRWPRRPWSGVFCATRRH